MKKLRYKNSGVDFRGDYRFVNERIKGKDKRILRKWTARKLLKEQLKGEEFTDEYPVRLFK